MIVRICAPDIFAGDAVGNHCLGMARMIERLGMTPVLYAERFDPAMAIRTLHRIETDICADDLLVVSYSILDPFLETLVALNCRKICYFHGITEPALLQFFEPQTARLCEAAIEQLPLLHGFDSVIANSLSTAQSLGWSESADVRVIPPVFADMPAFRRRPSGKDARRRIEFLVVGRVVPHKRIEDAMDIVAVLRQRGLAAKMTIVGSLPNYDYTKFLFNHARSSGMLDFVDFKGMIDNDDLLDCYDSADILIGMSQHEGFCVPVLEAMHFGKDVFVRGGTATQELCPPSRVFAPGTTAAMQAAMIEEAIGDAQGAAALESHLCRRQRAATILSSASDAVWRAAFAITQEKA